MLPVSALATETSCPFTRAVTSLAPSGSSTGKLVSSQPDTTKENATNKRWSDRGWRNRAAGSERTIEACRSPADCKCNAAAAVRYSNSRCGQTAENEFEVRE